MRRGCVACVSDDESSVYETGDMSGMCDMGDVCMILTMRVVCIIRQLVLLQNLSGKLEIA